MKTTLAVSMLIGLATAASANTDKLPITTTSDEAREMYIKGRDLADKLRATDAHEMFGKAVAKDKTFALAYLGMAQSSGTNKEFFDALNKAIALEDKASPAEKLLIQAADQASRNDLVHQKETLDKLVKQFPNDERMHNQLGQYYFARQDYVESIASYEKAIAINAQYSQPYNQLGYAYRFTDKLADAERTFKKYIELIPTDPNPYDSYGELLMQEGKFAESIASYEKALKIDKNFVASYVGIGNDQIFMGKGDEARKTFAKLIDAARNDGEKRQAIFWTGVSYLHEAAWDKALVEADKLVAIAKANKDLAMLSNDYNYIANVLLEAGRPDEALKEFKLQIETSDKANLPAEVKETGRRNEIYDEARVALVKHDLKTAKAKGAIYAKQVGAKQIPFEVRQEHELQGMIGIEEGKYKEAADLLAKANLRDPRVLYLTAVALQKSGDMKGAKAMAAKAADFNGLAGNYAYIRAKARAIVAAK